MTTIAYNRMTKAFFERTGAVTINLTKLLTRRSRLEKELAQIHAGAKVIIEFGGDNCRFDWKNIARNVNGIHLPKTSIEEFHSTYKKVIDVVKEKGAVPVLLGLAPIDSEKYFSFIKDAKRREQITSWLGGNYLYLANIHEKYVQEVKRIAKQEEAEYVDVASIFRTSADFDKYLEKDGISLNKAGYLRVQGLVQDIM
ncbi:MAG: SGNH/GDSL hydrolase family protein [Bacteroidales bacterium]|nr:SGNH/GDSL hydrolase family protein [Bacteroidales bacterium]